MFILLTCFVNNTCLSIEILNNMCYSFYFEEAFKTSKDTVQNKIKQLKDKTHNNHFFIKPTEQ